MEGKMIKNVMKSNIIKYTIIVLVGILLSNCASNTYSIKSEKNKTVSKVPAWYMSDIAEKKVLGNLNGKYIAEIETVRT